MKETNLLQAVVIEPPQKVDACVIWLHGLGANGHDFVEALAYLNLPPQHGIRFIFPHAPLQPVTINQGMVMPAWYDIAGLDITAKQDEMGVKKSAHAIAAIIMAAMQEGIASERIFLFGFSQGGALALHTALRFEYPLAGVASLSAYLPLHESLEKEHHPINKNIPIFLAHGTMDPVVSYEIGQQSYTFLSTLGYNLQWHSYPMDHTVSLPELNELGKWMQAILAKR